MKPNPKKLKVILWLAAGALAGGTALVVQFLPNVAVALAPTLTALAAFLKSPAAVEAVETLTEDE